MRALQLVAIILALEIVIADGARGKAPFVDLLSINGQERYYGANATRGSG